MESIFLQPRDDNLLTRSSGSWAIEKLDYLQRYIDVFETSMRNKWPVRAYIDLFAGPGKCKERNTGEIFLGSPLAALTTRYPFTHYYFVDKDEDSLDVLKTRCSSSPYNDRVHAYLGDANVIVRDVAIELRGLPSLNLAFLDPEGLELQWDTVATLAELNKMDLIIHYPQMGLTRVIPTCFESDDENNVDEFFGGEDWRQIYGDYRRHKESHLHRQLMDHYKANLSALGYLEALRDDEVGIEPLMSSDQGAPLYRLLFASKHPLGIDFWKKITARDSYGQRRLL